MEKESEEEKQVISMVDEILQYPSMRKFIEVVEDQFAKLFHAERANLILVDRFKKDMYKYVFDAKSNEDIIKTYPLEKGLAGYVAVSSHSIFVQNIDEDSRFNKEIDDPKGINCNLYPQLVDSNFYSQQCETNHYSTYLLTK